MLLEAITIGPAAELLLGAAAELQQFLPVLFKEIEDTPNYLFLLLLGVDKGGKVDVDMKAAGTCLMGQVAHSFGFAQ